MDASLILAILLTLALGAGVTLLNRAGYVLLLLLPASQLFGLLDPMSFIAKGVFDYHALFLIVIVAGVMMSLSRLPELRGGLFFVPMLVFMGLWAYGVLYPVVQHYSTLFYSLKASKEFMMLAIYFGVFLVLRTQSHVDQAWRFIFILAMFYSLLEIAAQPLGGTLMQFFSYDYRPEGEYFWKVYLPFWPVILLGFTLAFFELAVGAARPITSLTVLGVGLLLTFFRSYLLASFAAIATVLLLSGQGFLRTVGKGMVFTGVVGATLLIVAVLVGGSEGMRQLANAFIFSGVAEVTTATGGSLEARERYAKDREEIFERSPYIGHGFIDKESELGRKFRTLMTYGDTMGFVDKGDLDLKLKFGYIGTGIIYFLVLFMIVRLVRLSRGDWPPVFKARCLSVAAVLLVYLMVQPVHAALSFSFALLPLAIALGLVEREYYLLCTEQIEEIEGEEPVWSP